MTIAFRAPGKYLQSSGALDHLGQEVLRFGEKAVLAGTEGSLKRYGGRILDQCHPGELEIRPVTVGRETTQTEIDGLTAAFQEARSEVMIGLGGGKALDTARAAADAIGCPLILVPTVASNDAPCSALSVIHDEDGSVVELRRTTRKPDLVLVDTAV